MMLRSGMGICAVEAGMSICTASCGLNLVVRIKKVSKRNATSPMAVISIAVLFRGILTFGIIYNLTEQVELMFRSKRLSKTESGFINSIGQAIDFSREVVVSNDRDRRG